MSVPAYAVAAVILLDELRLGHAVQLFAVRSHFEGLREYKFGGDLCTAVTLPIIYRGDEMGARGEGRGAGDPDHGGCDQK